MKSNYSASSQHSQEEQEALEFDQISGGMSEEEKPVKSRKHLYWTGVVSAQLWQPGQLERLPIQSSIDQEKELYDDLEIDDQDGWELLFDPVEFNEKHKPLQLENYKLMKDDLANYAVELTEVRATINSKAK